MAARSALLVAASSALGVVPVLGGTLAETDHLSREFACDFSRSEWRDYRTAYDAAAEATASEDGAQRAAARGALARALAERTANVSDVLSCNVGVVAGYYVVARLASPLAVESLGLAGTSEGEIGLAYRLLQLALIFIFTLRNANRIPDGPGAAWGVSENYIIPAIMQLKKANDQEMHDRLHRAVPIAPSFRDPSLRIAIVSICAYPPDHPLVLPKVTPRNREMYASRHDYALRVHLEHPVIGAHGLGLQHAKLATVLSYLQSGDFDWVAWFDCDSIIMNMERTLDSIVYQYAQLRDPPRSSADEREADAPLPVCAEEDGGVDLSGQWLDSWVPKDMQEEASVWLRQSPGGKVRAVAHQFGTVSGQVEGSELELDFPESGPLRGRFRAEDAGDAGGTSGDGARLEWDNGAVWRRRASVASPRACREPCRAPDCGAELDPAVDLLITEEGWGLSSANWIIRRSSWSMSFLHAALNAAHVELSLFGDQDAMILHLMNQQALEAAADDSADSAPAGLVTADPFERHAAVIPQHELNSYDALNALTMDCDAFVEGDLLVTFPQCKDAEGCNDLFELAADYGSDPDKPSEPDAGAWWRRREGEPLWPRYSVRSSSSLRVFGPRPVIRDVFLREQESRKRRHDSRRCDSHWCSAQRTAFAAAWRAAEPSALMHCAAAH